MAKIDDLENTSRMRFDLLGLLFLIYILLMAIPFVSGVEMGNSLMVFLSRLYMSRQWSDSCSRFWSAVRSIALCSSVS